MQVQMDARGKGKINPQQQMQGMPVMGMMVSQPNGAGSQPSPPPDVDDIAFGRIPQQAHQNMIQQQQQQEVDPDDVAFGSFAIPQQPQQMVMQQQQFQNNLLVPPKRGGGMITAGTSPASGSDESD